MLSSLDRYLLSLEFLVVQPLPLSSRPRTRNWWGFFSARTMSSLLRFGLGDISGYVVLVPIVWPRSPARIADSRLDFWHEGTIQVGPEKRAELVSVRGQY